MSCFIITIDFEQNLAIDSFVRLQLHLRVPISYHIISPISSLFPLPPLLVQAFTRRNAPWVINRLQDIRGHRGDPHFSNKRIPGSGCLKRHADGILKLRSRYHDLCLHTCNLSPAAARSLLSLASEFHIQRCSLHTFMAGTNITMYNMVKTWNVRMETSKRGRQVFVEQCNLQMLLLWIDSYKNNIEPVLSCPVLINKNHIISINH